MLVATCKAVLKWWLGDVRASMSRQLLFFLRSLQVEVPHPVDRDAGQALFVLVVVHLGLVVIVVVPSTGVAQTTSTTILSVQESLIGIDIGQVVVVASFDSRRRVGNQVVAKVGEGALHLRQETTKCWLERSVRTQEGHRRQFGPL